MLLRFIGVWNKEYWCLEQGILVFGTRNIGVWNKEYWCLEQGILVFGTRNIGVWNKGLQCKWLKNNDILRLNPVGTVLNKY